jgi:hypothetical protein
MEPCRLLVPAGGWQASSAVHVSTLSFQPCVALHKDFDSTKYVVLTASPIASGVPNQLCFLHSLSRGLVGPRRCSCYNIISFDPCVALHNGFNSTKHLVTDCLTYY